LSRALEAKETIYFGSAKSTWWQRIEESIVPASQRSSGVDPAPVFTGHAFTASAMWHLMRAEPLGLWEGADKPARLTVPLWGHNTQVSTLQAGPQRLIKPHGPGRTE
jgi:hypothetical protein